MNLFSALKQFSDGARQLFDGLQKPPVDGAQSQQPSAWQRFGIFNFNQSNGSAATNDRVLRQLSEQIQTAPFNSNNKTLQSNTPRGTRPPLIDPPRQDETKGVIKPYTLKIPIPKGQETLSYQQLERVLIKSVFEQNKVGYSRASIEEIAEKNTVDFSPKYDYQKKDYKFNDKDGLWLEAKPQTEIFKGKQERVVSLEVSSKLQQSILGDKELSETIKASGKKTIAELSMNERMNVAMQIAYDKHLPHTVGAAIKDVDPKQLMVGVAVAGGIVAAASKAGASAAIPVIGGAITVSQAASYHAEAEHFLKLCATAKTNEDLDKAAQQFASVVKQGGIDITLTLATAGIGKPGAVSKAGGKLVDDAARISDDATRAALSKFKQWNDEIVAGMKRAFGEDLVYETRAVKNVGSEIKAVDELVGAPLEMRSKQTVNGAAPKDYLINALKSECEPRDYKFGNSTFKLDWAGMKHILERHHPKLWDGSVKNKQSYFDAKTKIEDLQNAVTDILKQNRETLIQRGTNSRFQIEGEYNGVRYTLGIENGRVRQLYAP